MGLTIHKLSAILDRANAFYDASAEEIPRAFNDYYGPLAEMEELLNDLSVIARDADSGLIREYATREGDQRMALQKIAYLLMSAFGRARAGRERLSRVLLKTAEKAAKLPLPDLGP